MNAQFWLFALTLGQHRMVICASLSLLHSFTTPFDRPSASFENSFILSRCLTITAVSLSVSVRNTTPEGVFSLCWCSPILTHSLPQWVYGMGAGATKEVTGPTAHRVYGMVRVPRNLDFSFYNCPVFDAFSVLFGQVSHNSLSRLLICKLKNSFIKWQSPSQIWRVKQQNHRRFVANWTDWTFMFLLFCVTTGNWSVPPLPWIHCALWSAFGLRRKLLTSFILPHYDYCISGWLCPRHNTRRHSLSMLVLSYSGHSQPQ